MTYGIVNSFFCVKPEFRLYFCLTLLCSSISFSAGKSSVLLDVKPWDDETDMTKLEEAVRSIKKEGLLWGACTFSYPLTCNEHSSYDCLSCP